MISGYTFLVWKDTGDEVVLDIVAFIADCDLPPVTKKNGIAMSILSMFQWLMEQLRYNTANNRNLLYSLSLVGPGDPLFKKALSALRRIHGYFDESFAEGVPRPRPAHTVGELDGVLVETRFITPVNNNPFMVDSIPDGYDPDGVLAGLVAGGKFKFTEDNIITFFQIAQDSEEYALLFFCLSE
jgi:hypothetical protein